MCENIRVPPRGLSLHLSKCHIVGNHMSWLVLVERLESNIEFPCVKIVIKISASVGSDQQPCSLVDLLYMFINEACEPRHACSPALVQTVEIFLCVCVCVCVFFFISFFF